VASRSTRSVPSTSPSRVRLLGLLAAYRRHPPAHPLGASVSLWISNTATAVMMVPIGMALLAQLESSEGRRLEHFGAALMLGVAYGANIGGIGTKHVFSSEQTLPSLAPLPPWPDPLHLPQHKPIPDRPSGCPSRRPAGLPSGLHDSTLHRVRPSAPVVPVTAQAY
jgi:hypothetical protein